MRDRILDWFCQGDNAWYVLVVFVVGVCVASQLVKLL